MSMGSEAYDDWLCEEAYLVGVAESGQWITADGRVLNAKDMTSDHIRNCIKAIDAGKIKRSSEIDSSYIEMFENELKKRGEL